MRRTRQLRRNRSPTLTLRDERGTAPGGEDGFMHDEISVLLLLAIFCIAAIVIADWTLRPKDRDDDD